MSKLERVIELAAKVQQLRVELRRAERELGLLIDKPNSDADATPEPETDDSTEEAAAESVSNRETWPGRVLRFMLDHPAMVVDAESLATTFRYPNAAHLRSTLFRLWKAEKIEKVSDGKYKFRPPSQADGAKAGSIFGDGTHNQ